MVTSHPFKGDLKASYVSPVKYDISKEKNNASTCNLTNPYVTITNLRNSKSSPKNKNVKKVNLSNKIYRRDNYFWDTNVPNREPHLYRKKLILSKYPQIKSLYGHDPSIKYKVVLLISIQLLSLHLLHTTPIFLRIFMCYTLSGSINHMLTLSMHEASHNTVAKTIIFNRLLGITSNLTMGIPASASFRRYHLEHHRYQGEDQIDVDIPCIAEGNFFRTRSRKLLWCFLQPLFYSLRPIIISPKKPNRWEYINLLATVIFDSLVYAYYGLSGLLYLICGTLFGMGLHPCAGHFISEHTVYNSNQETYSYYGPLNWLTFDVGYHNEHHDFPFISGKKLKFVKMIASEYYDCQPSYHSWCKVIYDYIMDQEIGPYNRIKRITLGKEEKDMMRMTGGLVK